MNLKSVKDRLKDDKLDLSFCDLEDVPVKEIAAVRKASHLDLSNNLLVSLPTTFVTLKQIVKLDLSKNMLTEIPENFGEMKQLKYLDLYANQISRLPLGLSELKNLRWLDLKENPLTPAVASVAGPCSNSGECQACARNIVAYLSNVKLSVEEEKLRRLNAAADKDADAAPAKKEGKKKRKKNADKEGKKNADKQKSKPNKTLQENESEPIVSEIPTAPASGMNHSYADKEDEYKDIPQGSSCETFISVITWAILILCTIAFTIILLPMYYKKESDMLMEYVESRTGVSVGTFQRQGTEILQLSTHLAIAWIRELYETISETISESISDRLSPTIKTKLR